MRCVGIHNLLLRLHTFVGELKIYLKPHYLMQSSITTTKKQCSGDQWSSVIPSLISTSMGGAVIGGTIAHISGALAGGAFGIVIALCSEYRTRKASITRN